MRDFIDLSIADHVPVNISVHGWPARERSALCERLNSHAQVTALAADDREIVLQVSRDGDLTGLKRFIRETAHDILPQHGLSYRY